MLTENDKMLIRSGRIVDVMSEATGKAPDNDFLNSFASAAFAYRDGFEDGRKNRPAIKP